MRQEIESVRYVPDAHVEAIKAAEIRRVTRREIERKMRTPKSGSTGLEPGIFEEIPTVTPKGQVSLF